MENKGIRWEQRLSNYQKALNKLTESIDYIKKNILKGEGFTEIREASPILNDIIKQGLIQSFEFTHELAWNVMKDYIVYQGKSEIRGSRDATREAFAIELIKEGEVWMDMIGSRNKTSHTYHEETANEIFFKIIKKYHLAFREFLSVMETIKRVESN